MHFEGLCAYVQHRNPLIIHGSRVVPASPNWGGAVAVMAHMERKKGWQGKALCGVCCGNGASPGGGKGGQTGSPFNTSSRAAAAQ
jgi:hypothetical protein